MMKVLKTALLLALPFSHPAMAAPITFNTALAVGEGEFVAREQLVIAQSGHDPGLLRRDRTEVAAVTALGYGLSSKLALFAVIPYRDIDLDLRPGIQRISRNSNGFGDLSLFARYTLFQKDGPGHTLRIAPFLGVEVPTGKDNARDSLGTLPPAAQTGSGSWDYFGGSVLTWQTLQYQIDSQISYRVNSEANRFEAGDILRLDASLQYRLYPGKLGAGTPGFLYGVLEANLIHQQKDRIAGKSSNNSGGTRLFLAPGIQYVTKRWIIEAAVQIPVIQDLNGNALENDYIFRSGVRFNF